MISYDVALQFQMTLERIANTQPQDRVHSIETPAKIQSAATAYSNSSLTGDRNDVLRFTLSVRNEEAPMYTVLQYNLRRMRNRISGKISILVHCCVTTNQSEHHKYHSHPFKQLQNQTTRWVSIDLNTKYDPLYTRSCLNCNYSKLSVSTI